MRKNSCSGWMYHKETAYVIDKNANGDAIGCHEANGRQSWHCLGCRHRDCGEMPKPRALYALTQKDIEYLGNAPAVAGGFVTVWDERDNGLALPELIRRLTGRQFLGTMPGVDAAQPVDTATLAEIIEQSNAQPLTSQHPLVRASAAQRRYRHDQILWGVA